METNRCLRLGLVSLALVSFGAGCSGTDGAAGVQGEVGELGEPGADGEPGRDGETGKDGEPGEPGSKGATGSQGEPGAEGAKGEDGTTGAKGEDGTPGAKGEDGTSGEAGAEGEAGKDGKTSRIRTGKEMAGLHCAFGGVRIETGLDADDNGALGDAEVDAAQTAYLCSPTAAWRELPALPSVQTAYSFSLALGPDGQPRLGYMFQDATYRQSLLDQGGVLWDGGGVYSGAQVLGIYRLGASGWSPYQGRLSPQTYRFSELVFEGADSYFTTSYSSFGGLVSAIKNGQAGAYALTPAFTNRRAHSIGFLAGKLYALIAQKTVGLTLSTYPADQLGSSLNNLWTTVVQLAPDASTVFDPALLPAGGRLVAGYILGGAAVVRVTTTPAALATEADFTVIGGCADAVELDLAWDGAKLYRSCIDSSGALSLASTDPSVTPAVWSEVAIGVTGAVTDVELATTTGRLVLGVRQGSAIRVYTNASDPAPAFDAVLPGPFDIVATADSVALAVSDFSASPSKLRTFLQ